MRNGKEFVDRSKRVWATVELLKKLPDDETREKVLKRVEEKTDECTAISSYDVTCQHLLIVSFSDIKSSGQFLHLETAILIAVV